MSSDPRLFGNEIQLSREKQLGNLPLGVEGNENADEIAVMIF